MVSLSIWDEVMKPDAMILVFWMLSFKPTFSLLPASWEMCTQDQKQQLEPDMEQQTVCKSGKEYVKAVYCHHAYLTYLQSTSCEMLGWMKLSRNQDCQQKYQ